MSYLAITNEKKYGFNLNEGDVTTYPEVNYLTEDGGVRPFTHIVSGNLISTGLDKKFSDHGYSYKPVYHVTPVYLEKVIKGDRRNGIPDRNIQVLNPRYMDRISYHFPDRAPVIVTEYRGKVKK